MADKNKSKDLTTSKENTTNEKTTQLVDKTQQSVAKVSASVEKASPSIVKVSPSVEKASPSIVKVSLSVEKASPSVEKGSPSIGKTSPSVEKTQQSVSPSVDKTQQSVEKASPSIDKTQQSVDKTQESVEKASPSVEKVSASVEKASPSVERTLPSTETEDVDDTEEADEDEEADEIEDEEADEEEEEDQYESILDFLYSNPCPTNDNSDNVYSLLFDNPGTDYVQNGADLDRNNRFPELTRKEETPLNVDELICKLLSCGDSIKALTLAVSAADLAELCNLVFKVFLDQPSLIEIDPITPVYIGGDLHGQYADLLRIFDKCGWPPEVSYLFLGDYVDRGPHSLETISLLLAYKYKFPNLFFLLRGNHELMSINQSYGFYRECLIRYGDIGLYEKFQMVFDVMPPVGLVGGKILCMHGGLSPNLYSLDQLREFNRPNPVEKGTLVSDMLWSDPSLIITTNWAPNPRGTSYLFSEEAVYEACQLLDIDLIVRAHQVVMDGFEFFADRKLVTVFSAPYYCRQFYNKAGLLRVDNELKCSLEIFCPSDMNGTTEQTTEQTLATTETMSITCEDGTEEHPLMRAFREETARQLDDDKDKDSSNSS